MHTLLEHLHQGGNYSAHIASHQAELSREEKFINQNSLSIYDLKIDYLNLDNSVRKYKRAIFLIQGAFTVEFHT